jgi:DNA-directed RNA polymerase subunit RPC12/RpoP
MEISIECKACGKEIDHLDFVNAAFMEPAASWISPEIDLILACPECGARYNLFPEVKDFDVFDSVTGDVFEQEKIYRADPQDIDAVAKELLRKYQDQEGE